MRQPGWRWPGGVAAGALLFAGCLAVMKVALLRNWQYTSNLFVYDQMLENTLRGHFGLEYTNGNQFGDHASLAILTLLPLKAILGRWMPALLVVLGPAIFAAAIVTWFAALSRRVGRLPALLATICVALPLRGGSALVEQVYGCTLDFASGYLAIGFASIMWSGALFDAPGPSARDRSLFFFFLTTFVLVKEEMAILAVVFLAVILFRRLGSRLTVFSLVAVLGVLLADAAVMWMSASEWNRGNGTLFGQTFHRIAGGQLLSLLHGSSFRAWATVGIGSLALLTIAILTGKGDPVAVALFSIGSLKLGSSVLVEDFDLTTWHNAPAVCMLTGGLILQLASTVGMHRMRLLLGSAALASGLAFLLYDLPELVEIQTASPERASYVAQSCRDLEQLRLLVPLRSVVAIDGLTSVEWSDGHRFSFFPRGVTNSPRGIADYVVLERPATREFSIQLEEFRPIATSSWFVLFERRSITRAHAAERERFRKRFGDDAIGVWP
ncbi:MAG TPA: hypothetical protein VHL58_12460 [Thermoanaerobaculia bacterium]|nr:hypothetical protein [Thermoanaerobaculia bacterium]